MHYPPLLPPPILLRIMLNFPTLSTAFSTACRKTRGQNIRVAGHDSLFTHLYELATRGHPHSLSSL
jgi:hypothetical protein